MAFHFLDRYDENSYNYNDQTKTGMCRSNMFHVQENTCVEIGKNAKNNNEDGDRLGDLTYEERLKYMQLTLKERGHLITIYKLMKNFEETDRTYLIMKKKERLNI